MVFRGGRRCSLAFPRSPVGAVQSVLFAMGAMLPPIPPSIWFQGISGLVFGKFLVNFRGL